MAKSVAPVQFLDFSGGVVTSGHPLKRPPNSAAKCDNLRVMPGGFLRLRGGRIIRYDAGTGAYAQFHQFQRADGGGNIEYIAQYQGANTVWQRFNTGFLPVDLEAIDITHGLTGVLQAITNVRNRCFFYNGQGVAAGSSSKPALSSWDGSQLRYVGLAAYVTSGAPTVTFALGSGHNNIIASRTLYVGLYNSVTGHFSNGVLAGTVSAVGAGILTVGNLGALSTVAHAGEASELRYVFYSSLDGGETPYLIMDATGLNPLTAAIGSGSKSLNITADDDAGFFVDVTQEMPIDNYPPRPMSHITFSNGRVYGILRSGGVGTPYAMARRESPKVVWSAAADDVQDRDFVGLPEESWPPRNGKYPPTGEQPQFITKGPNETNVLVMTRNGTFLLEETADGLHEWTTISATEGIGRPESYAQTPYGSVWITQNGQLVMLQRGRVQLNVLSDNYQALIPNGTAGTVIYPRCADYISSPDHQIDRYQVWFSDQASLVHDFYMGGIAYTHSSQNFTAAKTIADSNGMRFHLVASEKIYTHEVDPFNNLVPSLDQTAASTWVEVNGDYIGQWLDFGDSDLRKEITEFDVLGDCALSAQLGLNAAAFTTYRDLASTAASLTVSKTPQSSTDNAYRGKVPNGNAFWMKFRIQLRGHTADWYGSTANTQRYYPAPEISGDLAPVVSGAIWGARMTVNGQGGNRP